MAGKIYDDPDKVVDGTEKFAAQTPGSDWGILGSSLATYLASLGQALTNKTINAASNTISNITTAMFAANVVDTDGTLAANSDTRIASQKAVKTYVAAYIAAQDVEVLKGAIDCSANPNYPAADAGHVYRVSVAGKIGGASGVNVEVADRIECFVDSSAAGTQAAVGANWIVSQVNIDGAVVGPASVTDDLPVVFDGVSGKLIKSKTYAAFKTLLALVKGDVGLGNVDNTSDVNKPVSTAQAAALRGHLWGLTLSAAGGTGTFGVAAGVAVDSTGSDVMALGSAYTKTTSAWAVGSGNGGLDTGAIATNTWYHKHLIKRVDTGVVDVLFSLSATAPTLPTNYTKFRRIGSARTDGSSQWRKFSQNDDEFLWDVVVSDLSATNPGTSAVTRTLTVPTGVKVNALVAVQSDSLGINDGRVAVTSLDKSDETPSVNAGMYNGISTAEMIVNGFLSVRTNTSAQIRTRNLASAAGSSLGLITHGWIDTRGRLS